MATQDRAADITKAMIMRGIQIAREEGVREGWLAGIEEAARYMDQNPVSGSAQGIRALAAKEKPDTP